MPLPTDPERSPVTVQRYRHRGRLLVERARREMGLGPHQDLDYRRMVGWMALQRPGWGRRTWRQYKAWVALALEQECADGQPAASAAVAGEALEALLALDAGPCLARPTRTSANKLKRFPRAEFDRIVAHLGTLDAAWAQELILWLRAGLLTGLRPEEWGNALLDEQGGEMVLVVHNAKTTNQRGLGLTRRLLLGSLSDAERDQVSAQVRQARAHANAQQYERFYRGCGALLGRVVRSLWPRRRQQPTLYSLRHQFGADAKASGLTREEVAALMGHAAHDTAARHYGRKVSGYALVRVRADPAAVALVRRPLAVPRVEPGGAPQPHVAMLWRS